MHTPETLLAAMIEQKSVRPALNASWEVIAQMRLLLRNVDNTVLKMLDASSAQEEFRVTKEGQQDRVAHRGLLVASGQMGRWEAFRNWLFDGGEGAVVTDSFEKVRRAAQPADRIVMPAH